MVKRGSQVRRAMAVLVVMLLSLGPLAQTVDAGPFDTYLGPTIVEPAVPTYKIEPDARELLSNIDGYFTENKGQKGEGAGLFYCQGSPLSVALGDGWMDYDYRPEGIDQGVMFRVAFKGANPVSPIGVDSLAHKNNYFIGNDPDEWVTGASNYRAIKYPSVYDGIDCKFYLGEHGLKYDLLVAPGADPRCIEFTFEGVEGLVIDSRTGDLQICTAVGAVVDRAPYSYQDTPLGRIEIPTKYQLIDDMTAVFAVGEYDTKLPLVIDPELFFSTYIGGNNRDSSVPPAVDDDGNIFIYGSTASSDFPSTVGAYDTTHGIDSGNFVVKMTSDGSSLIFATFLGDSGGVSPGRIIVDSSGNPIVTGNTNSNNYPITNGAYQSTLKGEIDCYLTKLNSSGDRLIFSTYLGGNDAEVPQGLLLTNTEEIYLSGFTKSSDFPVVEGCYDLTLDGNSDLFIVKFDVNASKIVHGTYLGNANGSASYPEILLDEEGFIYVVGMSMNGANTPTTEGAYDTAFNGKYDVFALKMDANLSRLEWGTYLGGSEDDWNPRFVLDEENNLIIGTSSYSANFPTTIGAYDITHNGGCDITLTKLNASGDRLINSTFFGASSGDNVGGIDQDDDGNLLIGGWTTSDDFPVTSDSIQETLMSHTDATFTIMDANASKLIYSTYMGGSGGTTGHDSFEGIVWSSPFAILAGRTHCSNFPTTQNAFSPQSNGGTDAIVASFLIGTLNGTVPSEPLNLTAIPRDSGVTITWDPPSDTGRLIISAYEIYFGPSEDDLIMIKRSFFKERSFTHKNLQNGMEYHYGIKAVNWIGESNLSLIVNATPIGVPHAPLNIMATPSCASVSLTWEPPWRNGGTVLLGYNVYRGTEIAVIEHLVDVGLVTDFKDGPLVNGVTYRYYVKAYNEVGNGTESDTISVVPIGPPSEPTSLTITEGDSQFTIQWQRPVTDGGRSVTGYKIFRGMAKESLEKVQEVEAHIMSFIDTELTNGVEYHYAVQAFNMIGDGPLSPMVNGIPIGHPGVPIDLVLIAEDGQVTLDWGPPAQDGGTPVLGYEVFRGTSENDRGSIQNLGPDVTTYTDTGLMNGQTFYYSVCANNKAGDGPYTEVFGATPLALPDAPGNLVVMDELYMVKISWLRPLNGGGAEIDEYIIYRGISEDSLEPLSNESTFLLIFNDTDVKIGTTYHYAVSAVTMAGEGPKSEIVVAIPYGAPGPPTNLEATLTTDGIALSWEPPEDDGALAISGYVIMRGLSQDSLRRFVDLGDVTSFVDDSVVMGQTYYYTVAAVNEAGTGPYTEQVSKRTEVPNTVPSRALRLNVSPDGTTVTLEWAAPINDGGSPVTGYVILRGLTKDALVQIAEVGPGATTWSEDGLERGTTYYYSIAAKNNVGEGEAIAAREVVVPKEKEDESPGFEAVVVAISLLLVIPIIAGRRD